jgi:hypothetical protein
MPNMNAMRWLSMALVLAQAPHSECLQPCYLSRSRTRHAPYIPRASPASLAEFRVSSRSGKGSRLGEKAEDNLPVLTEVGLFAAEAVDSLAKTLVDRNSPQRDRTVKVALERMQRDMSMLDVAAGQTPQLSAFETLLLGTSVVVSFASPQLLSAKITEFLVPSLGALVASIGFSSEYLGKVAVSRGKEIAATSLQAAAESELYLAQAERAKAIIPLCVGIATTAAAFALVAQAVLGDLFARGVATALVTQAYLLCPILAVLAAAVAALATQESVLLCSRSIGVGARRFASAGDVGRTWLSATEQIAASVDRSQEKWVSFVLGVLPAPIAAVLFPGDLALRAIVASSVAAAQCAYSLARAEYSLTAAVESVSLKSRAAAVSDTYANQGARAGAVLPFTSALSGLCAAVTVAVVEILPLMPSTLVESFVCVLFPGVGATIAAAASISKARCEVDAAAATAAATQLASSGMYGGGKKGPVTATIELVRLTAVSTARELRTTLKEVVQRFVKMARRLTGRSSTDGTLSAA